MNDETRLEVPFRNNNQQLCRFRLRSPPPKKFSSRCKCWFMSRVKMIFVHSCPEEVLQAVFMSIFAVKFVDSTKPRSTPTTAYTKPRFTPTTLYTKPPSTHNHGFHQPLFTPNHVFTPTTVHTKPRFTPSHRLHHTTGLYTNHRLHQPTFYTNQRLDHTTVYNNREFGTKERSGAGLC